MGESETNENVMTNNDKIRMLQIKMAEMSDEEDLEIINFVKKFPELWSCACGDINFVAENVAGWNYVGMQLENPKSGWDVYIQFRSMAIQFAYLFRLLKRMKNQGYGNYYPQWKFYQALEFLIPVIPKLSLMERPLSQYEIEFENEEIKRQTEEAQRKWIE